MNNQPLVSILIPCFNHERYIEECIESVVNQTYFNTEIIVIDDGSTDNSLGIIEALSKKYGFYFEHQENAGVSKTLNKMVNMAKGDYVSLLASDDKITKDKIELLMSRFSKLDDSYCMVCGDAAFIDGDSNVIKYWDKEKSNTLMQYYISSRIDDIKREFGSYESLLKGNYIPALAAVIRKECLLVIGLFDDSLRSEDWDIWLRLAQIYKMAFVESEIAFYRIHDENFSLKSSNSLRLTLDNIETIIKQRAYSINNGYKGRWSQIYTKTLFLILSHHKKLGLFAKNMKRIPFMDFVLATFKIVAYKFRGKKYV